MITEQRLFNVTEAMDYIRRTDNELRVNYALGFIEVGSGARFITSLPITGPEAMIEQSALDGVLDVVRRKKAETILAR